MSNEHPNIANSDWRFRFISALAKDYKSPSGITQEAGTPFYTISFVKSGNDVIGIPLPDPSALYISVAHKASQRVAKHLEDFAKNPLILRDGSKHLTPDTETNFFNMLEDVTTCVVFSYSAIEVFANDMIPDNYQFILNRQDSKCKEIYDREQAERYVKLDMKIDIILPQICSVTSPKGTKIWEEYVWLKNLRDRLIHLKSTDWKSAGPDKADTSLWTAILSVNVRKAPQIAFDIIQYFHPDEAKRPRWMQKYSTAK